MKREGKTTVLEANGAKLIRWNSYAFCRPSVTTMWIVEANGEQVFLCYRKKDALPIFERAAAPLRERLCTPMTVGEAAIAASTVL